MTVWPFLSFGTWAHSFAPRRSWWRACRGLAFAGVLAVVALAALDGAARAEDPVAGGVKVVKQSGFTRLVFRLDETVDSSVRLSGAILIINFKKPVAVSVDRLSGAAPDDISAARSDPDGRAVRIALTHSFKVNSIPAAERLYVDLLPENWAGPLPGLPQDVVDELASRAREAERELSRERKTTKKREMPTVRVKVARLPTVMRYVFDIPEGTNVATEQKDDMFAVKFDRQVKFDLADVIATLPPTIESVAPETEFDSVAVLFRLNGMPDVRSFREERTIVVDVASGGASKPETQAAPADDAKVVEGEHAPPIGAPQTVPADRAPAAKDAPAMKGAPAVHAEARPAARETPQETPKAAEAPPPPKAASMLPPHAKTAPKLAAAPAPQESAKPDAKAAAKAEAKMEAKVEAKVEADVEAKIEGEVAAKQKAKVEPEPELKPAAKTEAKTEAKPAAMTKAEPAAAKPNAKPPAMTAEGGPPTIAAIVNPSGDNLRINFPFGTPTPAAVFRRADLIWLVFDNEAAIDLSAIPRAFDPSIRRAWFERGKDGEGIVRIRLSRPRVPSLQADGSSWVLTIGDTMATPPIPLAVARSIVGRNRASIVVPFEGAGKTHILTDPAIGDRLMVVTAPGPARGFLKPQDFIELHVLPSVQGVVVQPIADDIVATVDPKRIVISRPGGLTLSASANGGRQEQVAPNFRALTFDTQVWGFDRQAPYEERQNELIRLAASAVPTRRREARFNLARFYLARDMGAEAIGVLQVATEDQRDSDNFTGSILKAVANVMLGRPETAVKQLANPKMADHQDAPVWRAIAYAREGKWAEAHAAFKTADPALRLLPAELQRMAMQAEMRAAIEVHDYAAATRISNEFETMGVPPELEPAVAVLNGRLYQAVGRNTDALNSYRAAAAATFDRPSSAQGRLREIEMLLKSRDMPRQEAIHELETLTTVWRGDETETEGLRTLAHLYTEDNRYRDAFHVMRTALLAHPNSDQTRRIQDEAATTFENLFLSNKGDSLPPIEALGLFYDFRELTPIGRRGDEMIRRLSDRLVSVDLLDQAAELLQHQVDHRLQGAARAGVATKLAIVYLMNHKPDRALATLQRTRSSDLSNELRDQRLLLEARAMSEIGRHEVAYELVANIHGREADRLRADVLWAGKHYRRAAEQIEKMYGERWRQFTPLTDAERADILRAAIGYALSDEQIGLIRLREKYAAKMADGPDRRAFEVVTAPIGTSGAEFQSIARKVAATDTLDGFLRDLRARYPDGGPPVGTEKAKGPAKGAPAAAKTPAKPGVTSATDTAQKAAMNKPESALPPSLPKAPKGVPLTPDKTPTGSIGKRTELRPLAR
jgi:tetratricopeptide (TPR) repeat protein